MTEAEVRRLPLLRLAALAGLATSLLVATLVPVYTDEIGWRLQMRAAIDGVDIMFNDICGPNTLATPVWFMMPARWFSATANLALADPIFVRAAGVVCAALWGGLLLVLTMRIEPDSNRRAQTQAILLSLLGTGLLPFVLVLSRPEQPVLLITTAIILVTLLPCPARSTAFGAWAKVAVILVLASIALSYHLKGVLYSAVMMVCLAVCARGRISLLPRIVGCAALAALTFSAATYWVARFQCPGDPELAKLLAGQNMAAVVAQGENPIDFAFKALQGANPFRYVKLTIPTAWPMSGWLPPLMFPSSVTAVVELFLYLSWLSAIALCLLALAGHFWKTGWRGLTEPRVLIVFAIAGCVLVWGASQLIKNVYEASHVLPMLVIAFALAWSLPNADRFVSRRPRAMLALTFVTMALISQVLVLGASATALYRVSESPGYAGRQPVSITVADYDAIKRDIDRAMTDASIPSGRQLHRLLVDDLTYLALQRHSLPLHQLGVLSTWNGSIDDPVNYLRSRNSDGVVVGCKYLPANMRTAASRSGEICAISRAGLDRLASAASPPT